jgi:Lysozyme like domain
VAVNPTTATTDIPAPGVPTPTQDMTYDEVENAWIQAGGNPQAAAMAAAVADASSGLNPATSRTNPDGTVSIGLWLIPQNGTPPGSTDPVANARAAVQLSGNGTDWSQWCVTWSDNNCGLDQGTYLGEGSNALASLGQKLTPASYNVIGSANTGSGTPAGSSTAGTSTPASSSSSHSLILIGLLVLVVAVVYFVSRRRAAAGDGTPGQ